MDTFQRLKKWLAAKYGIPEVLITPETTLGDLFRQEHLSSEGLGTEGVDFDSLDVVELTMALEEAEFYIEIPDKDVERLTPSFSDGSMTIRQMVDLIDRSEQG